MDSNSLQQRLFPHLSAWTPSTTSSVEAYIKKIAVDGWLKKISNPNKKIPAGYTYLGQFLAHDMTFTTAFSRPFSKLNHAVNNVRSIQIDLDSVYGNGPIGSPLCYDQDRYEGFTHFKIIQKDAINLRLDSGERIIGKLLDFNRVSFQNGKKVALIADPRNDEHIVLSQIHLAIQVAHNKFVDELIRQTGLDLTDQTIETLDANALYLYLQDNALIAKPNPQGHGRSYIEDHSAPETYQALQASINDFKQALAQYEQLKEKELKNHAEKIHQLTGKETSVNALANDINALLRKQTTDTPHSTIDASLKNVIIKLHQAATPIKHQHIHLYRRIFNYTKQRITWIYQRIIIEDFLKKIVPASILEDIEKTDAATGKLNFKIYQWQHTPYLPIEFSVAFFRFGHSMVNEFYKFLVKKGKQEHEVHKPNWKIKALRIFGPKNLDQEPSSLLYWPSFFFDPLEKDKSDVTHDNRQKNFVPPYGDHLNFSAKIDSRIDNVMHQLTNPKLGLQPSSSIIFKNLMRSHKMGLPSGQDIAKYLNSTVLKNTVKVIDFAYLKAKLPKKTIDDLADNFLGESHFGDHYSQAFKDFCNNMPLWIYILIEADLVSNGEQLGPIGGRIVAEVIYGLIVGDPDSYWHHRDQFLELNYMEDGKQHSVRTMIDLLRYADLYYPPIIEEI